MTMKSIAFVLAMVVMTIISTTGGSIQDLVLMGTKSEADKEFVVVDVPSPLSSIELIFQVLPSNFNSLNFTELAKEQNPLDTNLGENYLASNALAMMTPNPTAREHILTWLGTLDEISVVDSSHNFLINAWGSMPKWEVALNCTFSFYENTDRFGPERRRLIRTNAYYLPKDISADVLVVYNTVQFPYIPKPVILAALNATPGSPLPTLPGAPLPHIPQVNESKANETRLSSKAQQLSLNDRSVQNLNPDGVVLPNVRNEYGEIHTDYVPLPREGYSRVVLLDKDGNLQSVFQMIDGQVIPVTPEDLNIDSANKYRQDAVNALQTDKAGYMGMDLDSKYSQRGGSNGGGGNGGKNAGGMHWTTLANPGSNKENQVKSTVHVTSENTPSGDVNSWSRTFLPYKIFNYVFGPKVSEEDNQNELGKIQQQQQQREEQGTSLPRKIYNYVNDAVHKWLGIDDA